MAVGLVGKYMSAPSVSAKQVQKPTTGPNCGARMDEEDEIYG